MIFSIGDLTLTCLSLITSFEGATEVVHLDVLLESLFRVDSILTCLLIGYYFIQVSFEKDWSVLNELVLPSLEEIKLWF